jgi:hypothetical protein
LVNYFAKQEKQILSTIKDVRRTTPAMNIDIYTPKIRKMLLSLDKNSIESYIEEYAVQLEEYIINDDPKYKEFENTLTDSKLKRYRVAKMKYFVALAKLAYARMHKDNMKLILKNPLYTVAIMAQIEKYKTYQQDFYDTLTSEDTLLSLVSKDIKAY